MTEKLEAIKQHPAVTNWSDWERGNMKRTYLNLSGYQSSFAGCRSTKVYWDHKAEKIVIERGKGTTPRDFDASINAIQDA